MATYTIGELAKAAGVPISTVRFYERAGLVRPAARSGGNYRQYTEQGLSRLRFIRSAQATGFSLRDIRELLSLTHSDDPPCEEVINLTRQRLADVRQRIRELRNVEKVMAKSLADCCTGQAPDLCEEITRLKGASARPCRATGACEPARRKKSPARA
jgi:MerR family mercuric resistance operon transcriptional regulator